MSNELLLTSIYRRAAISFLVLTVALLLVVAYVVLPNALVVITPSIEDFQDNYVLTVTPEPEEDDEIAGARFVTEIVLEQTFTATGEAERLKDLTGTVTIHNEYSRSQALVRTTRLLTENGILLRTDQSVTVPAGSKREVAVYLDDESVTSATLEPGRLTIPGLWEGIQPYIYGEITEPLTGETEIIKRVEEEDIKKAQSVLREKAEDQAYTVLQNELLNSQLAPPESIDSWELALVEPQKIDWDIDNELIGSSVDTFTISGTFVYEGVYYDAAMLEEKVAALHRQDREDEQAIIHNSEVQLTETVMEAPQAELLVSVNGQERQLEKEGFLEAHPIEGLSAGEAIRFLSSIDGVEDVKIELSPFWVTKIPKGKIDLVILSH